MSFMMNRCRLPRTASSVFLLSLSAFTISAQAQGTPAKAQVEEVLKALGRTHGAGPVAISPDGSMLAFVRHAKEGNELVVSPFNDTSKATRITAKKKDEQHCGEEGPTWAPDSKRLAYTSDCLAAGQQQIYVAEIAGDVAAGKAKIKIQRLTDAKGEVDDLAFSPDGARIGFLYVQGATRNAGALAAMKPWAGVIGEDGVEIQRVAYVDVAPHKAVEPTFATSAQLHVYEFDWSPDSKALAYVGSKPPGENTWWIAKLYTQAIGSEPKAIFAPAEDAGGMHGLQMAVPRWSPDGRSIAFIGGLMSDQGSTGGDVWLIPSAGGEARNLTPGSKSSPAWISWKDDAHLFVSKLHGGNSQLALLPVKDGNAIVDRPIYSFPGSVGDGRLEMSLSPTRDHQTFVFAASSMDNPSELYAVETKGSDGSSNTITSLQGLKQLTHFNDGAEQAWGKTESLEWKSDQFNVQGWLYFPKNYDPAKKYGMIVLVHGGPASAVTSSWSGRGSLSSAAFSALGYFVLEPNPRGSYGQGEAFTAANRKDFGYGDLRDILAGVDTVLAKYPAVDPKRLGLTGWSYGGFMTMFGVTQTNRFKAAVAGAGISNWQSYYGENSIDQWMTPYFGASVYKDPAVYAKSSAINFIDRIHTPTLVVVGDRDGECPAPQSFEFWHALRDQQVPTQLVVYPNEGHGFVNPEHRTDVLVRAMDWFSKYMPAGE